MLIKPNVYRLFLCICLFKTLLDTNEHFVTIAKENAKGAKGNAKGNAKGKG
jgi:hypothetical protein